MFKLKKEVLKDSTNVPVGTKYLLEGEIGYGTEVNELQKLKEEFDNLTELVLSDAVIIDVTNLVYWDSLALRSIFPQIIEVNRNSNKRGTLPVSFIGSTETDVYDAASERFIESGSDIIPWYPSVPQYLQAHH